MAQNTASSLTALQQYLSEQCPGLKLVTPTNPEFEAVRASFVKRNDIPLAIARPQTVQHVQALVRYCVEHGIDFVVRGGGHDCAGRSQVHGALTIDMRDITYVHVNEDNKTARVGGGTIFRDLTKALDAKGLITPVGTIASVGYVGWATLGGYGPFSTSHGLGVDQIIGAKLVNSDGELVDASDELLKGIRGGGGIFGVIVELTIKVYPLKELLVSLIVFDSSDLQNAWATYTEGFEKLAAEQTIPRALQVQAFGIELPGLGKVLAIGVSWAADNHDEGREWFNKIASLGNCIMNNIETKSVTAYTEFNESLVTYGSYGRGYTVSVKKYTPRFADILAKYTASIPGGGIALSLHMLRAPSPNEDSVFGSRVEHHMVELVAMTPVEDLETAGSEWARAFKKELKEKDPENVLEAAYVSLSGNDDSDYKKMYGPFYDELVALKQKYDPRNVFKHAVPRLSS